MLEEFRRRKMHKDFYEMRHEDERERMDRKNIKDTTLSANKEDHMKYNSRISSGPEKYFEPQKDEIFNPRDFTLIFIDSDSVTNVTTLNRINSRRVLIFCGNGNGIISYGKGKAEDYENAFNQAFKNMRNNLVCLSHDINFSSPKVMQGAHNDFRIKIWPQESPNYWGNPQIWKMLLHSGFVHCRYSCKSRKREPYSMIYAFFNAVTCNMTPAEIAQQEGRKVHHVSFGNKSATADLQYSNAPIN